MVTINGKELQIDGQKLIDYLNQEQFSPNRIAIELNGEILKKTHFDSYTLTTGDKLEIVHFVGGG